MLKYFGHTRTKITRYVVNECSKTGYEHQFHEESPPTLRDKNDTTCNRYVL